MLSGRRLSRVQVYAAELHFFLESRDQADGMQERLRLALIGSDPVKWLPIFFPEQAHGREVAEDEIEEEDITFEFADMDPDEAMSLLEQAMQQSRQGSVTVREVEEVWR